MLSLLSEKYQPSMMLVLESMKPHSTFPMLFNPISKSKWSQAKRRGQNWFYPCRRGEARKKTFPKPNIIAKSPPKPKAKPKKGSKTSLSQHLKTNPTTGSKTQETVRMAFLFVSQISIPDRGATTEPQVSFLGNIFGLIQLHSKSIRRRQAALQ